MFAIFKGITLRLSYSRQPKTPGAFATDVAAVSSRRFGRRHYHSLALPIEDNHSELSAGGASANATRTS